MSDASHVICWLLTIICFSLTWTSMVSRSWRVRSSTSVIDPNFEMDELDIVAKTIRRDGLWLTCLEKPSGEWQCDKIGRYNKPNVYGFIVATRLCIGISIFCSILNIIILPIQMPCAFADEPIKDQIDDGTKQSMTLMTAAFSFLSGLCNIIAISIYGTNVYSDDSALGYNITVLSWCSYLIIISGIIFLLTALILGLLYNAGRSGNLNLDLNSQQNFMNPNNLQNNNNNLGGMYQTNNYQPVGDPNIIQPTGILNYNKPSYGGINDPLLDENNNNNNNNDGQMFQNYDDYNTNTKMGDTYMMKDDLNINNNNNLEFDVNNDDQYI